MSIFMPPATDAQSEPEPWFDEDEALQSLSKTIVRAAFDDRAWEQVVEQFNLVNLTAHLKRVMADIGQEEQRRNAFLSLSRQDPDVSKAQFAGYKSNFHDWLRSASRVREKLRARLAEVQPRAQAIINAHNADRRALVILAKRIWLWEEGDRDDRLDYALDDVTISWSADDGYEERRPLRELIEDIRKRGEVTP